MKGGTHEEPTLSHNAKLVKFRSTGNKGKVSTSLNTEKLPGVNGMNTRACRIGRRHWYDFRTQTGQNIPDKINDSYHESHGAGRA